jgi:hypothetical protein
MRDRCTKPNHTDFQSYGGRGIKICERWMTFTNFLADMGMRPNGTTIDRTDNNGHYEPSNCRWATTEQQERNKRSNRWITANGKRLIQTDWARLTGIPGIVISQRLRAGWSEEDAVTIPNGQRARGSRVNTSKLTADKVVQIRKEREAGMSLPKLGRKYGVTAQSIWNICRGAHWKHIP